MNPIPLMCVVGLLTQVICAADVTKPVVPERITAVTFFSSNNLARPLRYTPVDGDFVITNGRESFNRPLYGGSSPFRVDAGDVPEFSLYLPGRGGNLRLGFQVGTDCKWLHQAKEVVARYHAGRMLYEIRDPSLGSGVLKLEAEAARSEEGFILRTEFTGTTPLEILVAFGGVNGMKGQRGGDIGCETEPITKFFQLRPEQCAGNEIVLGSNWFTIRGKPGVVGGTLPADAKLTAADARAWNDAAKLAASTDMKLSEPVVLGRFNIKANQPRFIGLQRLAGAGEAEEVSAAYRAVADQTSFAGKSDKKKIWREEDLPVLFKKESEAIAAVASRVVIDTPDPFVNASMAALNIATDAVWDGRQEAFLHGGVAWRVRLLGWRVSYAGDELGWHNRTAEHFAGFAAQQNTNPVPAEMPPPEESANLSRNETALHSNGDLTRSHYDMNLLGVDAFFRHLLWTGDLDYARAMWPVIERHLAWERRLFRREFGSEKLPLYEGYCCIWASDDLAYNGGGATHSSAFNYFHNRMAARVARLIGQDPQPYDREAGLILQGMQKNLWLADRGWFAEWKDWLGLQLVHPNVAAWTFYHTVDSEVPTPLEAWQMTRFVDTQIARFPIHGPGVPDGFYTMPTTSWMPYTWSLNNVVMAETVHTALGYWQANRPAGAFALFKGALLDSMYLGLCPGNVGMTTWYDANRRESQRDFGDGIGALARAMVEGLFGVKPDLLDDEVVLQPGFPAAWNHAAMRHPDFEFKYQRDDNRETYTFVSKFGQQVKLLLRATARQDAVAGVTVNGQSVSWKMMADCVGEPRIELNCPAASRHEVVIRWRGHAINPALRLSDEKPQLHDAVSISCHGTEVLAIQDPQGALSNVRLSAHDLSARATGTAGQRTVFLKIHQGELTWWQPVPFEIRPKPRSIQPMNWSAPLMARFQTVDLGGIFNDSVTNIFQHDYRAPRSPFCSLATPRQGVGSWCHPQDKFAVDDSGLRKRAAAGDGKITLPNGVPLATPGGNQPKNIAFVSQWKNYPSELTTTLTGKAVHAFLLMAGSTSAMQSQFDNGEVIVTYADGSTTRLALRNPTTWWPIDQDYFVDDFAFARPEPLPVRVDLRTGHIRVLDLKTFKGQGRVVAGGAATVLDLPLDPAKELKSLTIHALANEVVIGLMSLTLQR